jgi:hypothetical protein
MVRREAAPLAPVGIEAECALFVLVTVSGPKRPPTFESAQPTGGAGSAPNGSLDAGM